MLTGAGRPLRFAAIMLGLWGVSRAVALWIDPTASDPSPASLGGRRLADASPTVAPSGMTMDLPPPAIAEGEPTRLTPALRAAIERAFARNRFPAGLPTAAERAAAGKAVTPGLIDVRRPIRPVDPDRVQLAMLAAIHVASSAQLIDRYFADSPRLTIPPQGTSRWSASAWVLARGGGVPAVAGASQLGGGQAGGRVRYRLNDAGLSAAAGAAIPLESRGREAMLAIEWQPDQSPVRLVAEQRIALDDGISSGPGLAAVAGLGPTGIGAGFDFEGYGQAGAVARDRMEPYAEGAARLARPVATIGGTRIELGGGVWAGAQRDAQRVDIGPAISAAFPVAGQRIRVALDWRERVAGDARPNSGPALSIGADF